MTILSPALLSQIRQIRTDLLNDVQDGFSPCTFVAWRKDRPTASGSSWDDGSADEAWVQVVSGKGMLRNGESVPVIGQDVIYQQATYVLRTSATYGITEHMWLVVDGAHLFKVTGAPVGDPEKPIVVLSLSQEFGKPLPAVTP